MNDNSNIKILHIIWSGCKGGAEKNVADIVLGLGNMDKFQMEVLFLSNPGYWGEYLTLHNVKIWSLGAKSSWSPFLLFRLMFFLIFHKYDIYHEHFTSPIVKVLLKILGKKNVICSVHSAPYLIEKMGWLKKLLMINFASNYISPSNYVRVYLKERYKKESVLIYHGVGLAKNTAGSGDDKDRKSEIIIGTLTHLEKVKGNDLLPDIVLKLLQKGYQNLRLIICGGGSEYNAITGMIGKYKIKDYVKIIEGVKVEEFLKTIDIYISCSRDEALGIGVLEAMSFARPIVCSNIEAYREIVEDGKNGFVCNGVEEFVNKLEILIKNVDLRKYFGEKSREIVSKKFNLNQMLTQYAELYSAIGGKQ